MVDQMEKYLGEIEEFLPLACSTILDPRFKVLGFRDEDAANTAKSKLIEELANVNGPTTGTVPTGQVVAEARTATQKQRDELWEDLDENVLATRPPADSREDKLKKEFTTYLSVPNQNRKGDPIMWWNLEGKSFPNVRKLALKYLIIPGKDDKMRYNTRK